MVHVHCAPSRTFYLSLNFSFSNSTTNTISLCILLSITMIPSMFCRSRHDVSPIKSRSVPTKYVRSHDVFRTTYEMSDLIRIRIGSEGATDSSFVKTSQIHNYRTRSVSIATRFMLSSLELIKCVPFSRESVRNFGTLFLIRLKYLNVRPLVKK